MAPTKVDVTRRGFRGLPRVLRHRVNVTSPTPGSCEALLVEWPRRCIECLGHPATEPYSDSGSCETANPFDSQ